MSLLAVPTPGLCVIVNLGVPLHLLTLNDALVSQLCADQAHCSVSSVPIRRTAQRIAQSALCQSSTLLSQLCADQAHCSVSSVPIKHTAQSALQLGADQAHCPVSSVLIRRIAVISVLIRRTAVSSVPIRHIAQSTLQLCADHLTLMAPVTGHGNGSSSTRCSVF
ncbi:hypothetical protein J6590_064856 [Homalodisca vitripennis]|nr:hypothetical protein J6590_064856 [Homalodisca vitripennis]